MARAIGEFEKSRVFNRFTSKYDYVMADMTEFSEQERTGLELFDKENTVFRMQQQRAEQGTRRWLSAPAVH